MFMQTSMKIGLGISAVAHVFEAVQAIKSIRANKQIQKNVEAMSAMNLYLISIIQKYDVPLDHFDAIALTEMSNKILKP
jgi:hypothetical protein